MRRNPYPHRELLARYYGSRENHEALVRAQVEYYGNAAGPTHVDEDDYASSAYFKYADAYSDMYNRPPVAQVERTSRKRRRNSVSSISSTESQSRSLYTKAPIFGRSFPGDEEEVAAANTPSESYLQISKQSSQMLAPSSPQRKLLILDLNGTLCLRLGKPSQESTEARMCYPRAYMSTFAAYLFHPSTQSWLDTMVWSSAMPHNVADMVSKTFGAYEHGLKAVWARDKLGLGKRSYGHKVQTIKDLNKPWSQIFPQNQHSAYSSILLDDSPLKAVVQPYNHVVVPEYEKDKWKVDLQALTTKRTSGPGKKKKKKKAAAKQEEQSSFDTTLLAVIGVLEEIRLQSNVSSWIRAGGLWGGESPPDTTVEKIDHAIDTEESPDVPLWYSNPSTATYWVERGRNTLKALHIEIQHGITLPNVKPK